MRERRTMKTCMKLFVFSELACIAWRTIQHIQPIELSLIEMGESDTFPHVGRNTKFALHDAQNDVYPCCCRHFRRGGLFHSVLGELSDPVAQSEVQCLEGVITDSQSRSLSESFVQDLLSMIPVAFVDGIEA